MTLDEMKLAVAGELQKAGIVEPCCLKANCNGWIWSKNQKPIDWETMGLAFIHEAEKLLSVRLTTTAPSERQQYAYMLQSKCGELGACMATYEQRLESLCRVWFPERFK